MSLVIIGLGSLGGRGLHIVDEEGHLATVFDRLLRGFENTNNPQARVAVS